MLGLCEEALQDLDRADALEPHNAFNLQERGAVKWKLGMLEGALSDLDKAINIGGNDGDVLAFRAAVMLDAGDPAAALQNATTALELRQRTKNHRVVQKHSL